MQAKKLTHIATENTYETLRREARENTMTSMPLVMMNGDGQGINVRSEVTLSDINLNACVQANQWMSSPDRHLEIGMSWPEIARKYNRTAPKRFELAIWHREIFLCGLALGQPTWSGSRLRLDFIEGSPTKNALSGLITDITIVALEAYALSIGATQLRIMNPINEKVKNYYLTNDKRFFYDQRGNFCYRDL